MMKRQQLSTKYLTSFRKRAVAVTAVAAPAASVTVVAAISGVATATGAAAAPVGQPLDRPSDASLYVLDTVGTGTGTGTATTANLREVNIATGASTIAFSVGDAVTATSSAGGVESVRVTRLASTGVSSGIQIAIAIVLLMLGIGLLLLAGRRRDPKES